MVSQIVQESVLTLALLAVCLLAVATVLSVCVYAHRHWRVLRRWNTRNRELPPPGSRRWRRSSRSSRRPRRGVPIDVAWTSGDAESQWSPSGVPASSRAAAMSSSSRPS